MRRDQPMMAKRILVPLDGRESSEAAAALAADLARGSGGDRGLLPGFPVPAQRGETRGSGGHVPLLQVYPVPEHRVSTEGRVVAFADQEMDRLTAEGRDYLESVEGRLGSVPAETVVRFGEPREEVLT